MLYAKLATEDFHLSFALALWDLFDDQGRLIASELTSAQVGHIAHQRSEKVEPHPIDIAAGRIPARAHAHNEETCRLPQCAECSSARRLRVTWAIETLNSTLFLTSVATSGDDITSAEYDRLTHLLYQAGARPGDFRLQWVAPGGLVVAPRE